MPIIVLLLGLAIILLLAAWWLMRRANRNAADTGIGLSGVSVIYNDAGGGQELAEPLISEHYQLIGKPDYILQTREGIVPVEVKPTRRAKQPYESDIMQLAAYCLLVEEVWDMPPSYGLLRYAEISFKVEWTDELKEQLLAVLDEMHDLKNYPAMLHGKMPTPQHDMTARCVRCGFHYICWPD